MRRRHFLQLGMLGALGGASALARPRRTAGRVVIAGGGFAGATCARYLRQLNPAIDVTLVDPDTIYVTCPMSNEALAGLRRIASLTVSRDGLRRAGVREVCDRAEAVDLQRRRVRLAGGAALPYDRLVIAPGIRFLWDTPEGYDRAAAARMPHAWKAGEQTELLGAQLRAMDDGGVFAISVPRAPYRCPHAPYERASLLAWYLKRHKPRSKVLIFDANNQMPYQDLFTAAWQAFYPGMIEWIPMTEQGTVLRVDPATLTLHTAAGAHKTAVANIIPPQAPGTLALELGLCSGGGWCPVDPHTFESSLVAKVHVIGDACIADPMPRSASSANSQAKQCALAIAAELAGRDPPQPSLHNTCYLMMAPRYAASTSGIYRVRGGAIEMVPGAGGSSPARATAAFRAQEASYAEGWYEGIVADSFGT